MVLKNLIQQQGSRKSNSNVMSYQNVFGETLSKHADLDDKIVAITAAMPDGTGVNIFNKKFQKIF